MLVDSLLQRVSLFLVLFSSYVGRGLGGGLGEVRVGWVLKEKGGEEGEGWVGGWEGFWEGRECTGRNGE